MSAIPTPSASGSRTLELLANKVLRQRSLVGKTGRVFDNLAALSTVNNLKILHQICSRMEAKRTLEIGLAFGGSALLFASYHHESGRAPIGQHVAIDPFQSTHWDGVADKLLRDCNLRDFVDVRESTSGIVLPALIAAGEQFDLIYVDGSHLYEDVFIDFYFGLQLLSANGVILFDDSSDRHVFKVIKFIRANMGEHLEEVDLGEFRDDGWARTKYRIARRLGRCQAVAFKKIGTGQRKWNSPLGSF